MTTLSSISIIKKEKREKVAKKQKKKSLPTLNEENSAFTMYCNYHLFTKCLRQKTAKGPCGLRVKLPPPHVSITLGGSFTLSLFNAERQTEKL